MEAESPGVATSMLCEEPKRNLDADAVHLWVINVSDASEDSSQLAAAPSGPRLRLDSNLARTPLRAFTSAAEQERAARFRRPVDGERYLAAHAAVRHVLSRYLGCSPRDVPFAVAGRGKPRVPGSEFEFNLSHSASLALIAVARGRQVGVDVERQRPLSDVDGLAERVCTHEERVWLAATPSTEREGAFLALWTRKEALAKMTGDGLRAIGRDAWHESEDAADYRLEQLTDLPGYSACVAATGTDWRLVRCS